VSGVQPVTLQTADGCTLEGEIAGPELAASASRAAIVLCHPHPQFGGTMRSLVTSVLFEALPRHDFTCLRFNFRGVEASTGTYAEGRDEPRDIEAAIAAIAASVPATPVVLVGWSFGADMALTVTDPRLAGWVAIASPLRFRSEFAAASDPRPKHLVLAEHDEFRPPADVERDVGSWLNTTTALVPGASHFFVGRTDRVVTETLVGIDRALA
jgi:uncharacterized protein